MDVRKNKRTECNSRSTKRLVFVLSVVLVILKKRSVVVLWPRTHAISQAGQGCGSNPVTKKINRPMTRFVVSCFCSQTVLTCFSKTRTIDPAVDGHCWQSGQFNKDHSVFF